MTTKNIKISYAYDGSSFYGFQRQPKKRTVQGEIEKALKIILKEDINLISAGRTDRGVHALLQVSNFTTDNPIPTSNLEKALGRLFPDDIKLLELKEVDTSFHARFGATSRGYLFRLHWVKDPFKHRYSTFVETPLDPQKLEKILQVFCGRHNFNNFRLSDCNVLKPIREIYQIKCQKIADSALEVEFQGNAFLKSQIRIILAMALAVYHGKLTVEDIVGRLENPDTNKEKLLIPGNGLYLYNILYDKKGAFKDE